ncbi:MAG: RecX family transcriptional regulator [Sphingomicrobium sp.]
MSRQRPSRGARPLNPQRLDDLALRYVGRFATTRAKLIDYLKRKLRERGWEGDGDAKVAEIAQKFADLGYIDDRAFAIAKASGHAARGLGSRRLALALRSAGVEEDDRAPAMALAKTHLVDSALRLAQRRKLGPFASRISATPKERDKAIAALIRGGHRFDIARAIVDLAPGDEEGMEAFRQHYSHTGE